MLRLVVGSSFSQLTLWTFLCPLNCSGKGGKGVFVLVIINCALWWKNNWGKRVGEWEDGLKRHLICLFSQYKLQKVKFQHTLGWRQDAEDGIRICLRCKKSWEDHQDFSVSSAPDRRCPADLTARWHLHYFLMSFPVSSACNLQLATVDLFVENILIWFDFRWLRNLSHNISACEMN